MRLRTEDEIRKHLSAQRSSGLSVAAYCRREGICENTFHNWRKRFCGKTDIVPAASFIKLPFMAPVSDRLEVVLPNGAKVSAPITLGVPVFRDVVRVLAPLRPRG